MEKENINKKVEEALSVLDNMPNMQPKPFFYTRLMAKINQKEVESDIKALLTVPKLAWATLILLVIANISFISFDGTEETDNQYDTEEYFISEYEISSSDIYEINELENVTF